MTSGSQRSAAAEQDFARPGDAASLRTAASGDLAVAQNRLFGAKTDRHDLRGRIRLPASVLIKVEIHSDPQNSCVPLNERCSYRNRPARSPCSESEKPGAGQSRSPHRFLFPEFSAPTSLTRHARFRPHRIRKLRAPEFQRQWPPPAGALYDREMPLAFPCLHFPSRRWRDTYRTRLVCDTQYISSGVSV